MYIGAGHLIFNGISISDNDADLGAGLFLVSGTTWTGDPFGFIWNNFPENVHQEP